VTTSYLWCGPDICQARNVGNSAIRSYYHEGEFVPGAPAQPYYYGIDQIGSVRRAFASTSSAPAYGYDPDGLALQTTAPVTDFVYGGLFYNVDSGLYLANYRAYDPTAGRWLSRDPLGEPSDPTANLYRYVRSNPISLIDPLGLQGIPSAPHPGLEGGPWTEAPGQPPGSWFGPKQPKGPRPMCNWVPPESEGGPSGSKGYWKVTSPNGEVQRFDQKLNPISSEEAHPGKPPNPILPFIRIATPWGAFFTTMFYSAPLN
jgi:RHS repeat-associated protein